MQKVSIKNNEKGIILVVVLLVIFFLCVIGINYLLISQTEVTKSYKEEQFTVALATAEAGLERAIWYLVNDANLPNWSAPTPSNPTVLIEGYLDKEKEGEDYDYETEIHLITAPEGEGSNVGKYKIISTGMGKVFARKIYRRIEALVRISPMTGANGCDGAIICNSAITGVGNAQTDSYNSDRGKYNKGVNDGQEGNIFSNAGITLTGNAFIDGDAYCGPVDNVEMTGNAQVTGDKGSLGEKISLPDVSLPTGIISLGEIVLPRRGTTTLTLTEGIYKCEGISISGQAQLIIDGQVKLYCEGNIDISGLGGANYENNPSGKTTNFHIYCTEDVSSISLTGNDRFFGTIYAPRSEIKISGNGNVYGQVVANEVKFTGNGKVIYDEKLKDTLWWVTEGYKGDVISWREVKL